MAAEAPTYISRTIQRQILECLREHYPDSTRVAEQIQVPPETLIPNLAYLGEHGLCLPGINQTAAGIGAGRSTITAKGIDLLEDDGGLSAILGTVIIKLHAETVRDLINTEIDKTNLPEMEKNSFKKRLGDLSGKGLEAATADLVQIGIQHLPNAFEWLQNFFGL